MRIWRAPGAEQSASWTFAVPVLRVSSCTLLADGGRDRAAWKADGVILTPAPVSGSRIGQARGSALLSWMEESMTPTGGLAPPGPEDALVLRRISSARPSPRTCLSSCLVRSPSWLVVPALPPASVSALLTRARSASGWTPGSSATLPLGPVRIPTGLHGHPRGPPTQPGGTLPRRTHDSDPSMHSLPPPNPGRSITPGWLSGSVGSAGVVGWWAVGFSTGLPVVGAGMGRWRCRVLPAPCGGCSVSRRWCRAVVLGVFCAVVVVSACGRRGSAGPASSASSVSVSASLSQDELYAEAERVYRAYFELEQRAFLEGGVNGVPVEMNQYIMGWYAKSENTVLAQMAERRVRMQEGTRSQYTVLEQVPDDPPSDSLVSLSVCIDSTASPLVDADGNFVASGYDINNVFFKYDVDDKIKIYSSTARGADSCTVA